MKFSSKKERDQFILDHEVLIKKVIKDNPLFQWKNSDDLYQAGWEALIKCVDKYESKGVSFSTYAYNNIKWYMMRFIDDHRTGEYIRLKAENSKEPNNVLSLDYKRDDSDDGLTVAEVWEIDKSVDIEKDYELKELEHNFYKVLLEGQKKLKPQARQILELYFLKGYRQTEICKIVRCSRQAVKNCIDFHRHRAIRELKEGGKLEGWENFFSKTS